MRVGDCLGENWLGKKTRHGKKKGNRIRKNILSEHKEKKPTKHIRKEKNKNSRQTSNSNNKGTITGKKIKETIMFK